MAEEDRLPTLSDDGMYEGKATFQGPCFCGVVGCTMLAAYYRETGELCPEQTSQLLNELARGELSPQGYGEYTIIKAGLTGFVQAFGDLVDILEEAISDDKESPKSSDCDFPMI